MKKLIVTLIVIVFCPPVQAATFGSQVIESPLTVGRIYQSYGAATYVTFVGGPLTGCDNNGGYLRPSWSAAGAINHATTDRMLSVLLMAKAQNLSMEVRYRVNSDGTGWDKCSIDGLYLF